MTTLYDFGLEVQKIREAINGLTIKGSENASLIVYAVGKCNDIIKSINAVIEQHKNSPEGQNGEEEIPEEVEENAESDSRASTAD